MTKRDMTRKAFVAAMRRHGWETDGFLGYWHRNGYGISELNYPTTRAALAAFIKAGQKHDETRKAKPKTETA